MSLLVNRAQRGDAEDALAAIRERRSGKGATGTVTGDQAMRLSVVWACRTLRADLVSTMPLDVYRMAGGVQVEAPKPPVLVAPGGEECLWDEWAYSSQMDLDGYGNTFGVVEERDASPQKRPSVIRLTPASSAAVRWVKVGTGSGTKYRLRYRLGREEYDQADVWHEKQYTIPGCPVGLSPIGHAALAFNAGISAAEFAANWFGNGAAPASHLKNTARKLNKLEAAAAKRRFKASVQDGDVFVSGNDWEFKMLQGKASEAMFLEQQNATNADACRFIGVPGDMVDVAIDSSTVTYANITQRNLQFLILKLNPVLRRRESTITYRLLPDPWFSKFNRGVLLEMDPQTRATTIAARVTSRTLDVDEARNLDDMPPLTDEQIARFAVLFGNKNQTPPSPALPGGTS